ncbi:MAG: sensor histidine kinase [Clostridia bacterium]|nr:sensor histidine kinase [Clostridia bacterium]
MLYELVQEDHILEEAFNCVLAYLGARSGFLARYDVQGKGWEIVPCGQAEGRDGYCWQAILQHAGEAARPVQVLDFSELPRSVVPWGRGGSFVRLAVGDDPPTYLCAVLEQRLEPETEEASALEVIRRLCACLWAGAALSRRLVANVVLEERDRLRREIHDGVAQTLSYLILRARALLVLLERGELPRLDAGLRELVDIANEAYHDLRESLSSLRSPGSPEASLLSLVTGYAREFEERSGISTRVLTRGAWREALDSRTKTQLLRIIQEALTNVRKHARAREVTIIMEEKGEGQLAVRVKDDGCGFDPQAVGTRRQQFGLGSMKERARGIGARLEINSAPGAGTEVAISLPSRGGGWVHEQVAHLVS